LASPGFRRVSPRRWFDWFCLPVAAFLLVAGCVETTVKEPPKFRKFEPRAQTTQTAPSPSTKEPAATPFVLEKPAPEAPDAAPTAKPESTANGATEARVAILLPLSGPSAALGRAMMDAAQLSMFELADRSFVLMPFDTAGSADGARKAAAAAIERRAQLILGPLHAESVRAVAPLAREAGTPVIAFSNSREVAGDGIFIMGFVPRQQVNAVVGYAASEGLSRFAVLAPDDAYGAAVVEATRAVVDATGGFVVRTMLYDPAATDLTGEVKAFTNYNSRHQSLLAQRKELMARDDEVSRQALRRLERLDSIGAVPFDAVLLPESGERLRALSSLLSYYDVDRPAVRLLGLRSWDLIANLGSEPALIGAWFAGSPTSERGPFRARFRKAFERPPPRLATLAYDATALASILGRGDNGPDYSLDALTDDNGFLGVDGIFRLRREGIAERAFAIHEVNRDGTTVRRAAPQRFTSLTN
jgi:hypothetical protein